MLKSLYTKLALALLGLFVIIAAISVANAWFATEGYQQEVTQKLNRDLAAHIVAEKLLLKNQRINKPALNEVFHMMMVINPTIELYLLDTDGDILGYSAPPGRVQRTRIDLNPLQRFIHGETAQVLLGDDPRGIDRQKIFSAAPILDRGQLQGYLYVILGGEEYDGVVQKLQGSHILRLSNAVLVACLLLAFAAGLIIFSLLTRKLKRLTVAMDTFVSDDTHRVPDLMPSTNTDGDEIDRLSVVFRNMAQRIHAQMEHLKSTDSLRRELVANVSHDLRTPLATLQGYIETLLLKEDRLNTEERREYLEIAILHCQRINKLVAELFELAKLDARETKLRCELFSLAELVHDTLQKFHLRAQQQGIHIGANIAPELPFVNADIGLVERVLDNLLENALRHTPRGGSITILITPQHHRVAIQVADTGCGIPSNELPRIFDRFYQLDKSRNSESGSSGLGLAIAKRILELHGTNIEVQSTLNTGTVFSFELPFHYAS